MSRQERQLLSRSLVRQKIMLGAVGVGFVLLGVQLVKLETNGHDRLRAEANARHVRTVNIEPVRGSIVDRNGRLLAVSTPVDTVWAEPKIFCPAEDSWSRTSSILGVSVSRLERDCNTHKARGYKSEYMPVQKQIDPAIAQRAVTADIKGLHRERGYKRFYPLGPAAGHVVGFANIDEAGQEGVEKALNADMLGVKGRKVVHRDSKGRFVEYVEQLAPSVDGKAVTLSLDARLQYLASGYLEEAIRKHDAAGGSVVLVYVPTGEVLAMAGSPQFNPNDRSSLVPDRFRNRAVADFHEPGSTVKPFTIAMALESGRFSPSSKIDTGDKPLRIRGGRISDTKPHGIITVSEVVTMSSNIGAALIAMEFQPEDIYRNLKAVGFGSKNGGFLGEVTGRLDQRNRLIDYVTQSYGYGLSATTLQVARAYTVFATDGRLLPLTLNKLEVAPKGERVFSKTTAKSVQAMLEGVVSTEGTARRAMIDRYRIGGKTGTTRKVINGKYADRRYISSFVGMAPMSKPEFVMAVTVDDPRGKVYYGGSIAAPVFARLMKDALRLYNVAPDAPIIVDTDGHETKVVQSRITNGAGT